jgi:SnoaL-like domain
VTQRQRLIRDAFGALDAGRPDGLRALFAAEAEWVGVPSGDDTARCGSRGEIVELLARHHAGGRRFTLGRMLEDRDRVAVEFTVANPAWSSPVTTFKVFAFRPGEDVVVRLNDCLDESYALQVLAA